MPRGSWAGLAALVFVALAPLPAAGQDAGVTPEPIARSQAVEQELGRLAKVYEEGSLEEARAVAEYEVSRREQAALDDAVRRLDVALAENQTALTAAQAASRRAELEVVRVRGALASARRSLADAQGEVRHAALLSYVGQGELGLAATALENLGTTEELGLSLTYARVAGDVLETRVEALRRQEAGVARLEAEAEHAEQAAGAAQASLERRQATLQADRAERAITLAKVAAEVALQRRLVVQAQAAQAHVRSRIAELQAESAGIAALLRARAAPAVTTAAPPTAPRTTAKPAATAKPAPATTKPAAATKPPARPAATTAAARPPATTAKPAARPAPATTAARAPATTAKRPPVATTAPGTTQPRASASPTKPVGAAPPRRVDLSFPLPGWPIVSGYGSRLHPILGIRRMHEGIDIWAPAGTPVRAAGPGVVLWAGPRGGYGIAVIIDHGNGLGTVSAHLSAVAVSQGQTIAAGQTVGSVGQTGLAAGPHLHFEVRINGTAYDPLNFLRGR